MKIFNLIFMVALATASGTAFSRGGHAGGFHGGGHVAGSHMAGAGRTFGFSGGRSPNHFVPGRFNTFHRGGFAAPGRFHPAIRAGVFIGLPLAAGYYYPYASSPYYSYPPASYWNYCASAGAYFPYVQYCPEGWQRVPVAPY